MLTPLDQNCCFHLLTSVVAALNSFMMILYPALLFSTLKPTPTHLGIALSFFFLIPKSPSQIKIRHSYRFGCLELSSTGPVSYVFFLHLSQRHACLGIVFKKPSLQIHFLKYKEVGRPDLSYETSGFFFQTSRAENKTFFQKAC